MQFTSTHSEDAPAIANRLTTALEEEHQNGALIINADDWGRSREDTDRTLECVKRKAVSSVSAMMFMEDSERAAELALQEDVDAGLHLNLTTPFSSRKVPETLSRHLSNTIAYLKRGRLSQAVFHPGLRQSFEYVVSAQLDEYCRLYRKPAERIDGHHHMHLCANVLFGGLLPEGIIARRSFSFRRGEKSVFNRLYRRGVDFMLARRHRIADFFFALPPLEPAIRLERIFSLAQKHVVEVETHCETKEEYKFLQSGEVFSRLKSVGIAPAYVIRRLHEEARN